MRFMIFLFAASGVIGIASYAIYRSFTQLNALSGIPAKILLWLLIIMPVLFIGTTILGMKFNLPFIAPFYTASTVWLPILTYFFISTVILTVLSSIFPGLIAQDFYKSLVLLFILASLITTTYGIINAHIITVTNITIPKENRLSSLLHGKKIILVSDTHIGQVNNKRFLNKVVQKINSQNPDMVLFAGDLIDGPKINLEKSLAPMSGFGDNVYYTPGNHEVYGGNENDLYTITDRSTTGLRNSKVNLYGVDIIGLTYDAYEGRDALINRLNKSGFNNQNPTIAIHHDPKNNKFLQDAGVDLIISGHTHGGQFWPFTAIVKRIFGAYEHGLSFVENKASITTRGVGTWGPPVRIGTYSEIISITFE